MRTKRSFWVWWLMGSWGSFRAAKSAEPRHHNRAAIEATSNSKPRETTIRAGARRRNLTAARSPSGRAVWEAPKLHCRPQDTATQPGRHPGRLASELHAFLATALIVRTLQCSGIRATWLADLKASVQPNQPSRYSPLRHVLVSPAGHIPAALKPSLLLPPPHLLNPLDQALPGHRPTYPI